MWYTLLKCLLFTIIRQMLSQVVVGFWNIEWVELDISQNKSIWGLSPTLQSGIEGGDNNWGGGLEKNLKVNKRGFAISGGLENYCCVGKISSVVSCGDLFHSLLMELCCTRVKTNGKAVLQVDLISFLTIYITIANTNYLKKSQSVLGKNDEQNFRVLESMLILVKH